MSEKILVADDSLTIQKVIKITLADKDYSIEESLDSDDLLSKIKKNSYDLILLDINLSEEKTGYDLVSEIKSFSPSTPVLLMLGTFDNLDSEKASLAGVDDSIVKPFESSKFIQKCQHLIETGSQSGDEISGDETELVVDNVAEDVTEADDEVEEDDLDGWVVDNPSSGEDTEAEGPQFGSGVKHDIDSDFEDRSNEDEEEQSSSESFKAELSDWGVEVPGVISQSSSPEMPPVMEASTISASPEDETSGEEDLKVTDDDLFDEDPESVNVTPDDDSDEAVLPISSELDYPDIEELISSEYKPQSQMQSTEVFSAPEVTDPELESPEGEKDEKEEHEHEQELKREVEEELSSEDFWAVDDEKDNNDSEADSPVYAGASSREEIIEETQSVARSVVPEIDHDKLVDDLLEKILPLIEAKIVDAVEKKVEENLDSIVQKACETNIDRVAWEVIPDLAENLIRREIKDITESLDS